MEWKAMYFIFIFFNFEGITKSFYYVMRYSNNLRFYFILLHHFTIFEHSLRVSHALM